MSGPRTFEQLFHIHVSLKYLSVKFGANITNVSISIYVHLNIWKGVWGNVPDGHCPSCPVSILHFVPNLLNLHSRKPLPTLFVQACCVLRSSCPKALVCPKNWEKRVLDYLFANLEMVVSVVNKGGEVVAETKAVQPKVEDRCVYHVSIYLNLDQNFGRISL